MQNSIFFFLAGNIWKKTLLTLSEVLFISYSSCLLQSVIFPLTSGNFISLLTMLTFIYHWLSKLTASCSEPGKVTPLSALVAGCRQRQFKHRATGKQ